MKKFITIAALVAASTAVSNAATVLLEQDFTNVGTSLPDTWTSTSERSQTAIINENGAWANNWGQDRFYASLASAIDLSKDGVYSVEYTFANTSNNVESVFALAGDGFSISIGNSYDSDTGVYVGTGSTNVLSASGWHSFQSNTGTQINKDATIADSVFGTGTWTINLTLTASASGNDLLAVSGGNGTTTFSGTYSFSSDATLSVAGFLLDAANNTLSVKNVSITAIPEPSAFGLLAGIGALAFAVSRRRRSR